VGQHYLPVGYGRYGKPVVLGLVGASGSGKSHLLSAIIGEIERGTLEEYGITSRPLDLHLHKRFMQDKVGPLLHQSRILSPTPEGVVSFADALLIGSRGHERPVAFFDVSGEELEYLHTNNDTRNFLEIVDGLIFVVDPTRLRSDGLGDGTFSSVLSILRTADRLPDQVSAAIVLSKADLVRFKDPVTQWLRSDSWKLDPSEIVRESGDVYAYLYYSGVSAWTRPYHECRKATLHVVSATGGPPAGAAGMYPRGVAPRRVLAPLIALLAMTGVLPGEETQRVGT
jgi:hypothetical protein